MYLFENTCRTCGQQFRYKRSCRGGRKTHYCSVMCKNTGFNGAYKNRFTWPPGVIGYNPDTQVLVYDDEYGTV